ncbi:hypothetical protein [Enterobacter cloacae]|uniref:hypothetical protein n=1 Tax=Enterobacter cloacae TaxID=550 RepID=UPI0005893AA7|nr:hypothetical protein [Enterobacter cloacae]KIF96467.1 hypothetical protein SD66_08745 [Enterobacter cloacae]
MATIPTQTLPSDSQLSSLALNALRASMFLSISDPACAETLAARLLATGNTENLSTLSEAQLQLDAVKRAIWRAWDMSPTLVDYRRAWLLDDDLDLSSEEAFPVLHAKFSQLRTLISCAEKLLEPLGTNTYLEDVRQLLGTASDIAGGALAMAVFDEVAA